MTDLDHRFEALSRTRPPELWPDIEGRETRPLPSPPTRRRAIAVVVALAVSAAGLGVAALTFGGSERPKRTAAAVSDGRIAFAGVGERTWNIYTIEPDGGHLTMLTDLTGQVADDPAWSPDGQRIAYVVRESNGASDIWVINADGSGAYALTGGPGSSWGPTWSPDGSRLAYTHSAPGQADQIWMVGADGSNPRAFTYCDPPECVQDGSPAWSPDGSRIAFVRVSGAGAIIPVSVFIWPVEDSGPRPEAIELDGATWASDLAWSPDAATLAFARSTSAVASFGLWQVDADGSDLGPLGDRPSAQSPSWSPDGRHIAFMAPIGPERETLYVMGTDGTGARRIPGLPNNAVSPSWQPVLSDQTVPAPGRSMANGPIYFRVGAAEGGSRVESILPDGTGRHVVFSDGGPVHYSRIDFSPDGTRIAFDNFLQGEYGIETAYPDGTDVVRLTDGVNDSWASWSPDGTKILFSSTRFDHSIGQCTPGDPYEFGCPTDIYVMGADGSNVTRLTDDPLPEFMPVWSPDGSRIAFVREADPVPAAFTGIYTMNPDGSNVKRVSSSDGGSDFGPSWSPDGSRIVFAAIREEDWGIWAVNADGSNEQPILGGGAIGFVNNPVWSPDGSLIAFVGNVWVDDYSPDDALYVMRSDGTGVTPIADAPGIGVAGDIAWQPIPIKQTSSPIPTPPISEPASVQVRITTTRGVAAFPSAIAVGGGGVWVTAPDQDGSGAGEVIRLSPETGEVVARVPVRAAPGWEFGGAGITVANGSVWVVGEVGGETCCHAFVTRIDASTNEVTDEIELPGDQAHGNDVWVDGDAMYVLLLVDGASSLELAKVEIEGHTMVWRVPIPGQWSQTVFVAGGSVWVLGTHPDAHGPVEVDMLYRLDPGTGALIDQAPLPFASSAYIPSVAPETVWFRMNEGTQRFDALSAILVGDPVRPGPGCCGGPFVSDGSGGVWVVSSAGADVDRSVWHIDASGSIVAFGTIPDRADFENMQGQSYAFDTLTQTIWVQHYEDSVSRVEIVVSPSDVPD
jgi:Tol biopolymer transport system component